MPMLPRQIDAAAGDGTNGGRRPTVVPAPAAASPDLSARPRRRSFTAQDKRRFLADADRAAAVGGIGAILRREGIYASALTDWRRQRDAGTFSALAPAKRGPKAAKPSPLAAELALLQSAGLPCVCTMRQGRAMDDDDDDDDDDARSEERRVGKECCR